MTEITVQIHKEAYEQIKSEVHNVLVDIESGKQTGNMPTTIVDHLCRLLQRFFDDIEVQLR